MHFSNSNSMHIRKINPPPSRLHVNPHSHDVLSRKQPSHSQNTITESNLNRIETHNTLEMLMNMGNG